MDKMQAIIWENNQLHLKKLEIPRLKKNIEVKVKIYGTGICGTDLNVLRGNMSATNGMILGHEAVGVVVETGSEVKKLKAGDRVLIDPTQFCGQCDPCRSGNTCYCDQFDHWQLGIGAHGTFAEYYVGQERFMYLIPDSMSFEQAILVEPLSCVLNAIEKAGIKPWDSVLVIGGGPIGALCQLVCQKLACVSVISEVNQDRLKLLNELAAYAFQAQDLAACLKKHHLPDQFDVIIDAVGNQLETAQAFSAQDARIMPMGFDASVNFTLNPFHYLSRGLKLIGTGEVRQITTRAIKLARYLPGLEKLITAQIPLSSYKEAFENLLAPEKSIAGQPQMKVVLLSEPGIQ